MGALRLALVMLAAAVPGAASGQELARWQAEVTEASMRFGMPEAWIWRVMRAESAGHTSLGGRPIRSRKGAIGLMQLMPDTWAEMRRLHGLGSDPDDPRDNILAGTAYLRAMYERFGYPGCFAAYNAGPARYRDWLERGQALPRETIDYVARVTGGGSRGTPPPGGTVNAEEKRSAAAPREPAWRTLFLPLAGRRAPDSER